MPRSAYTLRLSESGQIEWLSAAEPPVLQRDEPGSTWWSRIMLGLLSLLPIDGLL